MKNRLQFSLRTSVLKKFFLDVANLRVAALSPRQRTRREAPSVFPLSVGGCASTRSLDVAAFIYKFTCKNFDQGQQWGKETTRLSYYRTEKKTSAYIFTRATPLVAPKPFIVHQKGTQRTCLRLPSLTY